MLREIIKIDEDRCNGCGLCIPNCHEGALQIIDGKARLISDLMCDGLGACIGHCPEGAMEIERREAEPYDEIQVIKEMVKKGKNTVIAHMKHLKDHGEFVFLKQAVGYLMDNAGSIDFPAREVIQEVHLYSPRKEDHEPAAAGNNENPERLINTRKEDHEPAVAKGSPELLSAKTAGVAGGAGCGGASRGSASNGNGPGHQHLHAPEAALSHNGGCPGSRSISFTAPVKNGTAASPDSNAGLPAGNSSQLTQWPVQMHLINPQASHFRGSDLLLAADCVAYSVGNFHGDFLKGKTLAIACPKLDSNKEVYMEKLIRLINDAHINTLTVLKMEVPCCSGIEQIAMAAVKSADRKVPVKSITIGVRGDMLSEEWL